jgi:hypothetical protein
VSKAAQSSRLWVLFLDSWTVCLTVWITGARRTILEAPLLITSMGNETVPITVAARCSPGYKYLLHSPLGTILHSFYSSLPRLGFPSLVLCFPTMEGKRGIKQERSSSTEGSPTASDAKTPPLAPSGTPSPPGSPVEVSHLSCYLYPCCTTLTLYSMAKGPAHDPDAINPLVDESTRSDSEAESTAMTTSSSPTRGVSMMAKGEIPELTDFFKKTSLSEEELQDYHHLGWLTGNVLSSIPKVDVPTVHGSSILCFESHLLARLGL